MAEVLKEAFRALGPAAEIGGTLNIVSSRHERSLLRRQGSAPAFLVTAGFENWLQERRALTSPLFSQEPVKAWLPMENDRVFGVSERVRSSGEIEKEISSEELEQIAAKLELSRTKQVAIGFLNSNVNPANEIRVASFFRERGLSVFTSHECVTASTSTDAAGLSEVARWQTALEQAFTAPAVEEEISELQLALDEALGSAREAWQAQVLGPSGWSPLSEASSVQVSGSFSRALQSLTANPSLIGLQANDIVLHLGLESFHLLHVGQTISPTIARSAKDTLLPLQPTQAVALEGWPVPTYGGDDRGYEPGPMLFGKSHNLALIDILFARERLLEIEGFTPLVAERARPRILETLFTLGKSIPTERVGASIDARDVAEDLELSAIERIAGEIARALAILPSTARDRANIVLTGALASSFAPLLKQRRPDLSINLSPEAEWIESSACLAAAPSLGGRA
jgi:hypothetical protein